MDEWIHSKFPSLPSIRKWILNNANVDISFLNQWIEQHKLISTLIVTLLVFAIGNALVGKRRRKLPPGPKGLPFIGYLPFLTKMPHVKLDQLRKKYGSVFKMYLGSKLVITLGTFDAIKEALAKNAFYGRPKQSPIFIDGSAAAEVFSGNQWKEQRRFFLNVVKDFGTNKTVLEENSSIEISHFVKTLCDNKGRPTRIRPLLVPSISNNISSLIFGRRFRYDEPIRVELDKNMKTIGECAANLIVLTFVPFVKRFLTLIGWKYLTLRDNTLNWIKKFMIGEIEKHKKSVSEENPKDYMGSFLMEMKKHSNNPDTTFTEFLLQDMTNAIFTGGSDTSRSTIEWCLLTMAAFPEVQKRVVAEIDDVIGKERLPLFTDVQKMPYTQAVLFEVMRWRNIAPFGVANTQEDTEVQGHFIPKDTLIFINLWAVHRDPENWLLPECFRPERFLSEDGKEVVKPEKFIPFGIGKRLCPGEALARAQIFLYFASILQKMTVKPVPGTKLDFTEYLALGLCPKDSELCFVPRE